MRPGVRGVSAEALSHSRGGFGTQIHVAVDGLGNPVKFVLTGGQVADITQGTGLIAGYTVRAVIADKEYDSDVFVAAIEGRGAEAVIPPKRIRIEKREHDKHLYKERNLAERFFHLVKHYRRVATRYEKTACNFLGLVQVDAIMVLLR